LWSLSTGGTRAARPSGIDTAIVTLPGQSAIGVLSQYALIEVGPVAERLMRDG
jgi:hypothetical protein